MEDGVGGAGGAVISKRLPDGNAEPSAHMSCRLTEWGITQREGEPFSYSGGCFCSSQISL